MIYCFNNGGEFGSMEGIAISDEGVIVARVLCTDQGFMMRDLRDQLPGVPIEELVWVRDPEGSTEVQAAFRAYEARRGTRRKFQV